MKLINSYNNDLGGFVTDVAISPRKGPFYPSLESSSHNMFVM